MVIKVLPVVIFSTIIGSLFYYNFDLGFASIYMFVIGLLVWNIYEYGFHRFAFHNKALPRKLKRSIGNGHRFHHRYPQDAVDIALPLILTLPFSLLSLGLIYLAFGAADLGWYYLGLILGLYNYELFHYAAHHWKINLRYFKYMKRYHLEHHHRNVDSQFMVSNPLFDFLFRTR